MRVHALGLENDGDEARVVPVAYMCGHSFTCPGLVFGRVDARLRFSALWPSDLRDGWYVFIFPVVVEVRTRASAGAHGNHGTRHDLGGSHRDEPDSISCNLVCSCGRDLLGSLHALGLENEH